MAFFSRKGEDPLVLIQKGEIKKAIKIMEGRLKKNPLDLNLKMRLGEGYEAYKDFEKATSLYLEIFDEYIKSGEKQKAFAILKKAEKISPQNSDIIERFQKIEEKKEDEQSFSFDIELNDEIIELTKEQEKAVKLLQKNFPLGENALKKIGSLFEIVALKNGEVLIKEGEIDDSLYLLCDGEMEVFSSEFVGGRIGTLKVGDLIGEVSFLKGVKRTATVVAKSDVLVAKLSGINAKEVLKPYPELLNAMEKIIEKRVDELIKRVKDEM